MEAQAVNQGTSFPIQSSSLLLKFCMCNVTWVFSDEGKDVFIEKNVSFFGSSHFPWEKHSKSQIPRVLSSKCLEMSWNSLY